MVLAREEAGAEKIFRNNGVQLLQRLLDTGEADLMLAALRTLVGICSEHQSRVGGGCFLPLSVHASLRPSILPSRDNVRQRTRRPVMGEGNVTRLQKGQHDWGRPGPGKGKAPHRHRGACSGGLGGASERGWLFLQLLTELPGC